MQALWSTQEPFSCAFGHFHHGDNQTNNKVILEQACSWPVRRQSFAKIPKRKEGRKRRFPYFIPSRPSKSFVFGEGEVIQDLDLHFTEHQSNTIIIMRRWWKEEVGRGGKKNITPSRCVWWNIFASSPGELLKTWLVKLGFSACYLCFFAQGQYFMLSWETHTH